MEKYVGLCIVAMIVGLIMIITGARMKQRIKAVYVFMMIAFGVVIIINAGIFFICFEFFMR